MAAGTLPDAPDIRPSVTSATRWPRSCSTPSAGVSLCSSGMPLAAGSLVAQDRDEVALQSSRPANARRGSRAWSSKTTAGALTARCSRLDRGGLDHARCRGCRSASSGRRRARTGRPRSAAPSVSRLSSGSVHPRAACHRRAAARMCSGEPVAGDGAHVVVQQAGVEQRVRSRSRCRRRRGSGSRRRGRSGRPGPAAARPRTGRRCRPRST